MDRVYIQDSPRKLRARGFKTNAQMHVKRGLPRSDLSSSRATESSKVMDGRLHQLSLALADVG